MSPDVPNTINCQYLDTNYAPSDPPLWPDYMEFCKTHHIQCCVYVYDTGTPLIS